MLLLPNELLIQILLRLSLKSLLRCKCVSKLWHSLISDPHFAKSHFELVGTRTHRLVYLETTDLETLSIDLDVDSTSAARKLDLKLPKPCPILYIIGSCRGFILLRNSLYGCFYIWNPCTSALKELPVSSIVYPFCHGFGYDPSTDDYLVVEAYCIQSPAGIVAQFISLSLRANLWKKIEGPRLPYSGVGGDSNAGLLFNWALHWFVYKDLQLKVIAAFDLLGKTFSEIPLPNGDEFHNHLCHLWVHGEFLSLCVVESRVAIRIWVMNEYKMQSSWTKSVVMPVHDIPTRYFYPVCSTKSGDIYGKNDRGELMKCNAKGEFIEHCSYALRSNTPGFIHSNLAMYVESLLPFPRKDG